MKRILMMTTAAFALSASLAMAQSVQDQIVTALQGQGFERIEVTTGLTQVKVEAIRGGVKVEYIYDLATGALLKQEQQSVDAGDDTSPGVEYDTEDGDFLDDSSDDSDDDGSDDDSSDDDDNSGSDDDSDDDNGGHGSDDDDDSGDDDSGDDDDNSDDSDDSDDDNGSDDSDDDNGGDDDNGSDDVNDDH